MKSFLLFIALFVITPPLFAADVEAWQLATANVSLVKDVAKELKVDGTVYGKLLELNKRTLWNMQEEDGTILTLVISYTPPNQVNPTKLVGFYRTFSSSLQRELESRGLKRRPIETQIVYLKSNPFEIRFFVRGSLMNVPPLVVKPD